MAWSSVREVGADGCTTARTPLSTVSARSIARAAVPALSSESMASPPWPVDADVSARVTGSRNEPKLWLAAWS